MPCKRPGGFDSFIAALVLQLLWDTAGGASGKDFGEEENPVLLPNQLGWCHERVLEFWRTYPGLGTPWWSGYRGLARMAGRRWLS